MHQKTNSEVQPYYKDYIENASPRGYRSLHITFYDNTARSYIEVQLRTKETDGLDDPVALNGEQFGFMSHSIHQCEAVFRQYGENAKDYILNQLKDEYEERIDKILGDGVKKLSESESVNYGRTNRSLHFMRSMKKGEKITEHDIGVLRTEKVLSVGLHPEFLENVIGATLVRDVEDGEGVLWGDLGNEK